LTPVGHDLLPVLQKSLGDMEQVLHDARALSDGSAGTVRLACLPSFAASLLPDLIREFRRELPHVSFQIRDVVASVVNALVRNEDVDVGLTGGDVPDASLEVLHAGEDRLCVVCPEGHPLTAERRIGLAEIVSYPLVLTAAGTSVRAVVDAAFEDGGCAPVPTCEPTYMMTAVAMVRAGLGVTILPRSAREVRAEPSLVTRVIDEPGFVRSIALVKKRGRTLPPVTEAFVGVIVKGLAQRGE
jgi:DNA-binding transcriptional LysR family regulator